MHKLGIKSDADFGACCSVAKSKGARGGGFERGKKEFEVEAFKIRYRRVAVAVAIRRGILNTLVT